MGAPFSGACLPQGGNSKLTHSAVTGPAVQLFVNIKFQYLVPVYRHTFAHAGAGERGRAHTHTHTHTQTDVSETPLEILTFQGFPSRRAIRAQAFRGSVYTLPCFNSFLKLSLKQTSGIPFDNTHLFFLTIYNKHTSGSPGRLLQRTIRQRKTESRARRMRG